MHRLICNATKLQYLPTVNFTAISLPNKQSVKTQTPSKNLLYRLFFVKVGGKLFNNMTLNKMSLCNKSHNFCVYNFE